MKSKPEIVVQKRQERTVVETIEVKCSCGKRPVHKCVKESGTGHGKMCFQ